jgi:ferredoxin-NADP reductase
MILKVLLSLLAISPIFSIQIREGFHLDWIQSNCTAYLDTAVDDSSFQFSTLSPSLSMAFIKVVRGDHTVNNACSLTMLGSHEVFLNPICSQTESTLTLNFTMNYEVYDELKWTVFVVGEGEFTGSIEFEDGKVEVEDDYAGIYMHAFTMILLFCLILPVLAFGTYFKVFGTTSHVLLAVFSMGLLFIGLSSVNGKGKSDTNAAKLHLWMGPILALVCFTLAVFGWLLFLRPVTVFLAAMLRFFGNRFNSKWDFSTENVVRTIHFIHRRTAAAVVFLGPFVVWTGWVRWGLSDEGIFVAHPVFFYGVFYILLLHGFFFVRDLPIWSFQAVQEICEKKHRKLVIVETAVVDVTMFTHPGGDAVLNRFIAKDATEAFNAVAKHRTTAESLVKRLSVAVCNDTTSPSVLGFTVAELFKVSKSGETVKKFTFKFPVKVEPGQIAYFYNGDQSRPFTIFSTDLSGTEGDLAIRIIPEGKVTPFLDTLQPGDSVKFHIKEANADAIQERMRTATKIVLIAAGTGITGLIPLVTDYLGNAEIQLIWWVKDDKDLFLQDEIESLQSEKLSSYELKFGKPKGRADFLVLGKTGEGDERGLVICCGPSGFMEMVEKYHKNIIKI